MVAVQAQPVKDKDKLNKLAEIIRGLPVFQDGIDWGDSIEPESLRLKEGKSEDLKFSMGVWASEAECGTVCCIAGLAVGLWAEQRDINRLRLRKKMHNVTYMSLARHILGLTTSESLALFLPFTSMKSEKENELAAAACERLAAITENRDEVDDLEVWGIDE